MRRVALATVGLSAILAAPARAQVGVSISALSNDTFRGRSLSAGQPVASFNLSYDDPSGLYGGGSVTGVETTDDGPQLLGYQEYLGYARRLDAGPTLDMGVVNTNYTSRFSGGYNANYTELYAGIITNHFSSHLYYSPDYFRAGLSTLYGEVDGVVNPFGNWRFTAHAGLLQQISGAQRLGPGRTFADWRLGVAEKVGPFDLQVAWTGAGPGQDSYGGQKRGHDALVFGVSYSF